MVTSSRTSPRPSSSRSSKSPEAQIPPPVENSTKAAYKANTLARGKACLTCRRRKMRCDGKQPVCSQCKHGRRENECEFDDGHSKSRTQLLMENVSRLEKRLQEIDSLQRNNPSPLDDHSTKDSSLDEFSHLLPPSPPIEPPFFDPIHSIHPTPGSFHTDTSLDHNLGIWYPQPFDSSTDWLSSGLSPINTAPLLPVINISSDSGALSTSAQNLLIETFFAHQHQFGIYLPQLFEPIALGLPLGITGGRNLPHGPLRSAVLLWGCRFQDAVTYHQYEPHLLMKVLEDISDWLSNQDQAVHVIQATALLSTYFYSSGRLLEGKYHADAAAALVIALEMHSSNIKSFSQLSSTAGTWSPSDPQIKISSPSFDKLRTFWNVFELGCWAMATGSPPPLIVNLDPRTIIRAPWPTSHGDHTSGGSSQISTLDAFLHDSIPMQREEDSVSLRAKAAALLQLSTRLASTFPKSNVASVDSSVWESLQKLENCIMKCSASLGPLPNARVALLQLGAEAVEHYFNLIMVHTFISVAMMLLHHPLAPRNPTSKDKCQTWARKVLYALEQIPDTHYSFLHPMISMCWAVAADIIIQEMVSYKEQFGSQPRIQSLEGEVESLFNAMALLSKTYPIAEVLSKRIRPQYLAAKQV